MISRDVSKGIISEVKEEKGLSGQSKRKVDGVSGSKSEIVVEIQNGEEKEKGGGEEVQRPRGERRRSKANPRLSNLPKHLRGEQVAAGWPPWLTAVCGEALSGWIPRKADTFEKIDKVCLCVCVFVYNLGVCMHCIVIKKRKNILCGNVVCLKLVATDYPISPVLSKVKLMIYC